MLSTKDKEETKENFSNEEMKNEIESTYETERIRNIEFSKSII